MGSRLLPLLLSWLLAAAGSAVEILDTRAFASYACGNVNDCASEMGEQTDAAQAQVGDPGNTAFLVHQTAGAAASVSANPNSIEVSARAVATVKGGGNPNALQPDDAVADGRVDFRVTSPTNYLLAVSGWNLRRHAVSDREEGNVQLLGPSGNVFAEQYLPGFRSGPLVQPFGGSSSGVLAPGDYIFRVHAYDNAYPIVVTDEQDTVIDVLGNTMATRIDVLLGVGGELQALANGGQVIFDAASSGTVSSSYSTTGDLASVLTGAAASSVSFAVTGAQAQVWEIDFSGELDGVATVELVYDDSLLDVSEEELTVQHFDEATQSWEQLAAIVDSGANRITVQTSSFSPFVLAVVPEPSTAMLLAGGLVALAARRRSGGRRSA